MISFLLPNCLKKLKKQAKSILSLGILIDLLSLPLDKKKQFMNKIFYFCICIGFTFLISCNDNNKYQPKLDEQQFTNMLIDIHIVDGSLSTKNIYRTGKNYRPSYYYNSIYKKYDLTRSQFDSCVTYYSNDTKNFTLLYDQVIDSLNRLETKYRIQVKKDRMERDTVNLWTKKTRWRIPSKDKNTLDFTIPISQKGLYTVSASIKIFKDDQTDNPKIEAYFWKKDSLGEEHKVSFMPLPITKDMKFNKYEAQMEYPDSSYTELRGNFFAGENDLEEFTQHFEVKDILIFNPQIRPDSVLLEEELRVKDLEEIKRLR